MLGDKERRPFNNLGDNASLPTSTIFMPPKQNALSPIFNFDSKFYLWPPQKQNMTACHLRKNHSLIRSALSFYCLGSFPLDPSLTSSFYKKKVFLCLILISHTSDLSRGSLACKRRRSHHACSKLHSCGRPHPIIISLSHCTTTTKHHT